MKHFRPRLSRRAFWVLCALLVCLRLALTGFQQAYIWVGGAPLDDELMFRAANHITAGEWLGAYDYLTLSKAMFFPVWLALLHALHLPYLISGAALWCGAALLAAFAFAALCVAGFFGKKKNGLLIGYIVAVLARGFFHTLGGYLYWMDYMPENFPQSLKALYPIIYNYSYLLDEGVLTVILISLPPVKKALQTVARTAHGAN